MCNCCKSAERQITTDKSLSPIANEKAGPTATASSGGGGGGGGGGVTQRRITFEEKTANGVGSVTVSSKTGAKTSAADTPSPPSISGAVRGGRTGASAVVPNFASAIQHFCIHAGGKAVLDALQKVKPPLVHSSTPPLLHSFPRSFVLVCSLVSLIAGIAIER